MLRRQPRAVLVSLAVVSLISAACRRPHTDERTTGDEPTNTEKCTADFAKPTVPFGMLFPTYPVPDATPEDWLREDLTKAVLDEVNDACGPLHSLDLGRPIEVLYRGVFNSEPEAAGVNTDGLIALGAAVIVSTLASVGTLGAVPVALANALPMATAFAPDIRLSGCSLAELADPAVVKSPTPVHAPGQCFDHRGLVFRGGPTTSMWSMAAAEYLHRAYPSLVRAALFWPDNGSGAAAAARDTFRSRFESTGAVLVSDKAFAPFTHKEEFVLLLKETAASDPEVLCVLFQDFSQFLSAYVELRDDPTWTEKPPGYDTVRFVFASGDPGDDYRASFDAGSLDVLVNQAEGIESAIDVSSVEWQKLHALLAPMYLEAPYFEMAARIYDSMLVLALALAKAGVAEGPAIAAEIRNVANPPGELVYPGEFAKAKALLAAGQDIDYVGAGFADIDERGDATGITWGVWVVSPDGTIQRNVDLFQVQP